MGLLKHLRSRSRLRSQQELKDYPKPKGRDRASTLPRGVLQNIFSFVAPHTTDESYEVSEKSMVGLGCMLCDLRDLSNCAKVCRTWALVAQNSLYRSVRIDAVHFCDREEALAEQRRKAKIDPANVPNTRLRLLQRTLWETPGLATGVLFLKLPYMTRETCKADLARTVSALPNLRYVDLPDGFYSADPGSQILRDELSIACMDIRRMAYHTGSEQAFESLAHTRQWSSLEVLELVRLEVEPQVLRTVLSLFPALHTLQLSALSRVDDTVFQSTHGLRDFPPVHKLLIEQTPGITATGLVAYLNRPEVRENLSSLTLTDAGVAVPTLHSVLWAGSNLTHLSITETVSRSFPLESPPPLSSISLQTLHFEISSDDSATHGAHGAHLPAEGYYAYLAQSLQTSSLPSLHKLYVRDPTFPEILILAPPTPGFAPGRGAAPMQHALEIYTKGPDSLEWMFANMSTADEDVLPSFKPRLGSSHGRNASTASMGRPVSAYHASHGLGPQWGGEARMSVIMTNGAGGFLAVPPPPSAVGNGNTLGPGLGARPPSSGGLTPNRFSFIPGNSLGPNGWHKGHHSNTSSGGSGKSKNDLWR